MTILMISSEAVPFAKTGGLGDMVPALTAGLGKRGHDIAIVMPRYYGINRKNLEKLPGPLGVPTELGEIWCGVYKTYLPGTKIPVWLLDREDLFGRSGLYGPDGSSSWSDNSLRFAFLSSAAFQLSRYLHKIPDIIHAHDWQAAPAAWLLDNYERNRGFTKTASVLTIHNLGYQGVFSEDALSVFPPTALIRGRESIMKNGSVNFLAAGIHCANAVNTVSPTYAKEIFTKEFDCGLGKDLLKRDDGVTGILNGIDYKDWNPRKDKTISPNNYGPWQLKQKEKLKKRLQQESGLPLNSEIPLFGMITRLTGQKGVDLLSSVSSPALEVFRKGQAQLVLLGTGEEQYEEAYTYLSHAFPENIAARITFSSSYSRLIEAGSDFFLMPSRYEPCGLNQLYSLCYGTLPIVRRTGGLADTVIDIDENQEKGNGFVFSTPSSGELNKTIKRAINFYIDKKKLNSIRRRAMRLRHDWNTSAKGYENLYISAVKKVLRKL